MLICFIILFSLELQLSPDFNPYVYKGIQIVEFGDFRDYLVILQMKKLRPPEDEWSIWEGKVVQPEGTGSAKPWGEMSRCFWGTAMRQGGGSREREKEMVGNGVRGLSRYFRNLKSIVRTWVLFWVGWEASRSILLISYADHLELIYNFHLLFMILVLHL